jgi:hypothetical protein
METSDVVRSYVRFYPPRAMGENSPQYVSPLSFLNIFLALRGLDNANTESSIVTLMNLMTILVLTGMYQYFPKHLRVVYNRAEYYWYGGDSGPFMS